MENASKALIIAGTILIILVLISLGIFALNETSGIRKMANQNESVTEITAFNNVFFTYENNNSNAAQVKKLIQIVKANNTEYGFYNNTPHGTDRYVELKGITSTNQLSANKVYKVYVSEFNRKGFVSEITIEEYMK